VGGRPSGRPVPQFQPRAHLFAGVAGEGFPEGGDWIYVSVDRSPGAGGAGSGAKRHISTLNVPMFNVLSANDRELVHLIARLTRFEGEIVWDTSKPDL